MRFEYRGENRWMPLTGVSLVNFVRATGAQIGPGLPQIDWQFLPFYDFTALIRLPDVAGGASEWYLTNGGRFWAMDKFGVAIAAMNETAQLRLTKDNVASYFRFYAAFTAVPSRLYVLGVTDPDLIAEAAGETDPLLRGIVVEGQDPEGFLISATVLKNHSSKQSSGVERRYFRINGQGEVKMLDQVTASLSQNPLKRAG